MPDLASLVSLREAAARLRAEYPRLDLLVNNAGGINPRYCRTGDGFETRPSTTSARSRSPAWSWTCCWHQRKANHDHQAIRLDRHGAG
jgi:NAD(P)-dependent dehydrogenase (short-subunit alcohol dehydrogenase family)